ncbi:unnamed protein product [Cuscuta epithymum]|uniref:Uncharacterized protein n=1 Tax=Cuscuta epithymum TaxID=186058 RepID=A0AAV0F498_9ASTE|nr:unnamed protein product [Cuscuta epithymum]
MLPQRPAKARQFPRTPTLSSSPNSVSFLLAYGLTFHAAYDALHCDSPFHGESHFDDPERIWDMGERVFLEEEEMKRMAVRVRVGEVKMETEEVEIQEAVVEAEIGEVAEGEAVELEVAVVVGEAEEEGAKPEVGIGIVIQNLHFPEIARRSNRERNPASTWLRSRMVNPYTASQ